MPKKHSPSFVPSETTLYAVNRAAKRLALRQGLKFQYVGLQPLSVNYLKGRDQPQYVRYQDGQVVDFIPYYNVHIPKAPKVMS
jgi:hypothetical protein